MQNVKINVKGDTMTIVVNLKKTCGPSKSGKSTVIATTSGNANVEGTADVKIGLNVFKPIK
jgi:hypothetical protein